MYRSTKENDLMIIQYKLMLWTLVALLDYFNFVSEIVFLCFLCQFGMSLNYSSHGDAHQNTQYVLMKCRSTLTGLNPNATC